MTQTVEVFNASGTWINPGVDTLDYVVCIGGSDNGGASGSGGGACAVSLNLHAESSVDYVVDAAGGQAWTSWDTLYFTNFAQSGVSGGGGSTSSCQGDLTFSGGNAGTTGGGGAAGPAGDGANGVLGVGGIGGPATGFDAACTGGHGGNTLTAGTAPGGGAGSGAVGKPGRIVVAYTRTGALYCDMPLQEDDFANQYIDLTTFANYAAFNEGSTHLFTTTGPGGSLTKAVDIVAFNDLNGSGIGLSFSIRVPVNSASTIQIFAKRLSESNSDPLFEASSEGYVYFSDTRTLKLGVSGSSATLDLATDTIGWHHYAFVFNADSTIEVFLDGVSKGLMSGDNPAVDFSIGALGISGYAGDTWHGSLCGFKVYSGARTQPQIAADALLGGIGGATSSVVFPQVIIVS